MKKIGLVLSSIAIFFTLSTGVTAQTTSPTLTDANAVKIAASASNHFWSALHGYKTNHVQNVHLNIKELSTCTFALNLIQKLSYQATYLRHLQIVQ